jgi:hypothetical protein
VFGIEGSTVHCVYVVGRNQSTIDMISLTPHCVRLQLLEDTAAFIRLEYEQLFTWFAPPSSVVSRKPALLFAYTKSLKTQTKFLLSFYFTQSTGARMLFFYPSLSTKQTLNYQRTTGNGAPQAINFHLLLLKPVRDPRGETSSAATMDDSVEATVRLPISDPRSSTSK